MISFIQLRFRFGIFWLFSWTGKKKEIKIKILLFYSLFSPQLRFVLFIDNPKRNFLRYQTCNDDLSSHVNCWHTRDPFYSRPDNADEFSFHRAPSTSFRFIDFSSFEARELM